MKVVKPPSVSPSVKVSLPQGKPRLLLTGAVLPTNSRKSDFGFRVCEAALSLGKSQYSSFVLSRYRQASIGSLCYRRRWRRRSSLFSIILLAVHVIMSDYIWGIIKVSILVGGPIGFMIPIIHNHVMSSSEPPVGAKVCTKSGTYEMKERAPGVRLPDPTLFLSREGKISLCTTYVESFEKAHNTFIKGFILYPHYLKKFCGINPAEVRNNIRHGGGGGINN